MAIFWKDQFAEASPTPLASHAPDVGGTYSLAPHAVVQSGKCYFDTGYIEDALQAAVSAGGPVTISGSIDTDSSGNSKLDVWIGVAGSTLESGYALSCNASGGAIGIYKVTAGPTYTPVGSAGSSTLGSSSPGVAFAASFNPTTHVISYTVNGVTTSADLSASDPTFDGTGRIAIGGRGMWVNAGAQATDGTASGPVIGIATETDAALALSSKQIRALGLATETDAALALTGTLLAGLPFNTAPYEFGQRTGLDVADFSVYASTALNVSVYAATDVLLTTQLFAYTESTGSDGRLTRKTHASLVAGTTYIFVAVTAGGALVAAGRITAT